MPLENTDNLIVGRGNTSYKISYENFKSSFPIGDGQITITQGGVAKGSFTVNQTGPTEIDLDEGGGGGSVDLDSLPTLP